MRIAQRFARAVPSFPSRIAVDLALAIAASSSIAAARQATDFASLTWQGVLPTDGASGSVATFGLSADGSVIAFHSFASDVVPGLTNPPGHTYVRDRRDSTTWLASVSSSGVPGNGQSIPLDVSWAGRWILFRSQATNLDPIDLNMHDDVFVHDRQTSTTALVSLGPGGVLGNASVGYYGSISGDANVIAFESWASNWVAGDTNGKRDVFRRDRAAGTTTLVSVALSGAPGNGESAATHMSDDGRYVVFDSSSSDLVAGDTNGRFDIFMRDTLLGTTTLVSVGLGGAPANRDSFHPQVSNDGRWVAFESDASNLVAGDSGVFSDCFVRDLATGTTTRASLGLGGVELNHAATYPCISADGAYVSFSSRATNHGFPDLTWWDTDVFLFHVPTATLSFESVDSSGSPAIDASIGPQLSADGRTIAFSSYATNLGSFPDTNNYVDVFVRDAFPSQIQPYCTAKTSSHGCVASMRGDGVASASAPAPFFVRATSVDNQKPGLVFYGFTPASTPFQGGTICVSLPHTRTLIQHSGGDAAPASNCTGVLTVDFNALIQSGADPLLSPGTTVFCQAWYRDPPGPFHSALSNGLRFPILP